MGGNAGLLASRNALVVVVPKFRLMESVRHDGGDREMSLIAWASPAVAISVETGAILEEGERFPQHCGSLRRQPERSIPLCSPSTYRLCLL